jgi:Na+/proline symporter
MSLIASPWALVVFVAVVSLVSLAMSRRTVTVEGFFEGSSAGIEPSLWTLVLSQVTTWIFARSLMNAAILGYFYGTAGTLAYTCYYLSFLTGGFIVSRMRAEHAGSVQDWLGDHFGALGHWTYNSVIALRLLSEVFANLIVVGLIFTAAFPSFEHAGMMAIVVLALIGLIYSARGGLQASLRTDVLQMLIFLVVFSIAFLIMISSTDFSLSAVLTAEGMHDQGSRPGWVLVAVALLQVFSYPAHDPVMMDRGFIADRKRTSQSFGLAFVLSAVCIFGFGMFGIQAGLVGAGYENQLLGTWQQMFGPFVYFLLICSLLVSAVSTLDSALASSSRLVIDEFGAGARTINNGRLAMGLFMVLGTLLTLFPNKTLFDAVAVTGTASMFLTPVLSVTFFGGRVPRWAYAISWIAAMLGAVAYMYHATDFITKLVPGLHKYDQLLSICVYVLAVGFAACILGAFANRQVAKS